MLNIKHHGAVQGVTGSCHELFIDDDHSILIDCGLFQGAETSGSTSANTLAIEFDLSAVQALFITHVHIDHVGRLPYLLAAGFRGPIYCSKASAVLLPLVIEDALKVGVTRNASIIKACLNRLDAQLIPVDYGQWLDIPLGQHSYSDDDSDSNDGTSKKTSSPIASSVQLKLYPAGHILGSAFGVFRVRSAAIKALGQRYHDVLFSGDLGAPHSPLLSAPKAPYRVDQLVIESTYGDHNHENRATRRELLRRSIEHALADAGSVLIPAFSIGRTQELLYELEHIIHQHKNKTISHTRSGKTLNWADIDIIIDSPLASRFTKVYRTLQPYWDKEAKARLSAGRHPLNFEQMTTIDSHQTHLQTVAYLQKQSRPAIVIAASGMCTGGRIVNYLKVLISDAKNDILFVGYQAQGTAGRDILRYHHKGDGYVMLDGQRFAINAQVSKIGGYSAHAGQRDLLSFIRGMRIKPRKIHIVHGDDRAKETLATLIKQQQPDTEVVIGQAE